MRQQSQNGFALIGVLIVVGLLTSATVAMAIRQNTDIDLTYQIVRNDQSTLHAKAIELWAGNILMDDLVENTFDSKLDLWNTTLDEIEMSQGTVSAKIIDLNSRFNINNLLLDDSEDNLQLRRFERLLDVLGLNTDIASAVMDWLDSDTETRFPAGAEDDYYLSLDTAYRSANQVIQDISELRKVRGVDQETYSKLLPYVSALPVGSEVNINTASAEVIMSLAEGIDYGEAKELADSTDKNPLTSYDDDNGIGQGISTSEKDTPVLDNLDGSASYNFQYQQWLAEDGGSDVEIQNGLDNAIFQSTGIDSEGVGVSSDYFAVNGLVNYDRETFIIGSVVYRDSDNESIYTMVRKYGEFYYQ